MKKQKPIYERIKRLETGRHNYNISLNVTKTTWISPYGTKHKVKYIISENSWIIYFPRLTIMLLFRIHCARLTMRLHPLKISSLDITVWDLLYSEVYASQLKPNKISLHKCLNHKKIPRWFYIALCISSPFCIRDYWVLSQSTFLTSECCSPIS